MRELVLATISGQDGIEIVGQIQDDAEIEGEVERTHPDFLIVALDESDSLPGACQVLLGRYPHMKIIAISPSRDSTMFYWATLNIRSNRIESSEEGVLGALRGKMQFVEQ
ncbi:MAG TPA: hypothetical protein VN661_01550 [Candidatus Acidoferrales bacterium]|nr:hypothetical protein [Candidatus Acidoferrales bacterium]